MKANGCVIALLITIVVCLLAAPAMALDHGGADRTPCCEGDVIAEGVPCWACLVEAGRSWKPTTNCPGRDLQYPMIYASQASVRHVPTETAIR